MNHELRSRDDIETSQVVSASGAGGKTTVAVFAVVATTTVVLLQCLRVLFPLAYSFRERSGLPATVVLLAIVFVAPVMAPGVARMLGARKAVLVCAVVLGCLRLAIQSVETVPLSLAAVASAAALITLGLTLAVFSARGAGRLLMSALVTGLAVDTSLRGAWATWDVAWQRGALPALVAFALSAVLVASAALAARRAELPTGRVGRAGIALGPYLMLQVLLLQSIAFVASSAQVALASAVGVVLIGDVLALLSIGYSPPGPRTYWSRAAMGGGLVAITWSLTATTGSATVVLVLLGQVLATTLLAHVFATPTSHRRGASADAWGLGVGSLLLGVFLALYQIHYDAPLPVSNRWLPALAGALLAALALTRRVASQPDVRLVRPGALSPVLGVGVLAAVIFGGLALTEPSLAVTHAPVGSLRVVTYNVHEAVSRDGQLDPDAIARAVKRLDADVVVVEEAGRGWALSGTMDLGEWIKRRLHLPYVWVPAADNQFGNLILSRVPIHDAKVVSLPQGSGTMARSAVIAHVGPVAGKTVTVIGTHLQNGSSASRRRTRIQELRVLLAAWNHQPHTVLAGDLNSDPASPELRTLLDAGFTTTQPATTCALKTSNQHCVDWILSTSDLRQSRVRTLAVDTSDHRPLVATVQPWTGP